MKADPNELRVRVEAILGKPRRFVTNGDHDFACPFCHKSDLHVHFQKNAALCHKCDYRTRNLWNLIRDLKGDSSGQFKKALGPLKDIGVIFAEEATTDFSLELPKEFTRLYPHTRDIYAKAMLRYLRSRRVTDQQLDDYSLGYCESGRFEGMVVIPVYVNGVLAFFTTRRVFGVGKKTLNPKVGESKRFVLLGYDRVCEKEAERVYVVEGPFDFFAGEQAGLDMVCVMGSTVTIEQAALLSKLDAEIVICFDLDASDKARKFGHYLQDHCPNQVYTCPPESDVDLSEMVEDDLVKGIHQIRKRMRHVRALSLENMVKDIVSGKLDRKFAISDYVPPVKSSGISRKLDKIFQ